MRRDPQPVYSHGGSGVPGWPAVPGTLVGSGNPVEVGAASGLNWPRVQLSFINNGAVPNFTVVTEINPGPADPITGLPHADHWLDISSGGDVVVAVGGKSYNVPPDAMYVRTRITAHTQGQLDSLVLPIELPTGQRVEAKYPTLTKGGPL